MKSKYKAAFFDLDGTLVWTNPEYITKIVRDTVKNVKNIIWSREQALKFWFDYKREDMLKEEGISYASFWKSFNAIDNYKSRIRNAGVYEDIDFLKKLKKEDIKIGIITSCYSKIAEKEVEMIGREYIDDLVIANKLDKQTKPKPHPEGIYKLMKSLDVKPKESIMVGDGEDDILVGKKAGIYTVHIDRKLNPVKIQTIPDKKIDSLSGLVDLFY